MEIYELQDRIRTFCRSKEKYDDEFKTICAALDLISDCNDAIHSYIELPSNSGRGINYVYIYGIIHILNIQTDAVKVIYQHFLGKQLKLNDKSNLQAINLLRNKVFSHQIKISDGKFEGYGIAGDKLSSHSFMPYSLLGDFSDDKKEIIEMINDLAKNQINNNFLFIEMNGLIEVHQNELSIIMEEICKSLGITELDEDIPYIKFPPHLEKLIKEIEVD
ncbi:hypothetical protein [Rodentibacter myodis]|uniref:Uncharacterized protein n=1 Tax=Rodentibacter myodis TaxID=1907939 RepID=A0A1V3JPX0_9PAST|nr:hypothetical protein [Rodentibacter myodis]OOF58876.1 hypothetical protein BKL49_04865 [Rodentibacter myodis]